MALDILDTISQVLTPSQIGIEQFAEDPAFAGKSLYPGQAVLLKLIFLEEMTGAEEDLLTYWMNGGRNGNEITLSPNIRERRDFLRENGYKHFREVQLVGGRRSSKGFVTGLAMAYVMYNTLMLGDPGAYYGIDKEKDIYFSCIAGSEAQAKEFQYADLVSTVETCKAFDPYLVKSLETEFRVATNADLRKMNAAKARGGKIMRDIAKLRGKALAANAGTLRGSATMAAAIDEMAHMLPGESKASADMVYCLDPDTKVLKTDLTWVAMKDLSIGDHLVSMDENAPGKIGQTRKMRVGTVKGIRQSYSAPLKLTFEDGTSVICSDNHRWLTHRDSGNTWKWTYAGRPPRVGKNGHKLRQLRVGDVVRHIVDPWAFDTSYESGWLSGIFDGEGSISTSDKGFQISFVQNPGRVLQRGCEILESMGYVYHLQHSHRHDRAWTVEVNGIDQVFRLLGETRPLRLLQNATAMWEGKVPRCKDGKSIVSIERLPHQELLDIETTTGTFLAEGFVSHNTALEPSLDQFGLDGLVFLNSSPYTKVGMFYECYEANLRPFDPTLPVSFTNPLDMDSDDVSVANGNPRNFTFQFASWTMFEHYRYYKSRYNRKERGKEFGKMITVSPDWVPDEIDDQGREKYSMEDRAAILQARAKEAANPEAYKVERRGKFAEVTDAYLNPSMVDQMYRGVPDGFETLPNSDIVRRFRPIASNHGDGAINLFRYKFHVDPSSTTAGFGFAIGHIEYFLDPTTGIENEHVVFDLIKRWDPVSFPGKVIRWKPILQEIATYATMFRPFEITFDQHQSMEPIQDLQDILTGRNVQCRVYEKFAPQPLDAKVLTPMGWTTMGELAERDLVIGSDGRPHEVEGIFPQGVRDVYRVTFSDGSSTECTLDHLWRVRRHNGAMRTVTLQAIVDDGLRYGETGPYKWSVNHVDPVEFAPIPPEVLPIDPYLLGSLLGDGCFHKSVWMAAAAEDADEQESYLEPYLPAGMTITRRNHGGWDTFYFKKPQGVYINPLAESIRRLGLWYVSGREKFIPEQYLRASIADRVALLQGLMDTDGHVGTNAYRVNFSTISPALAQGVMDLVGSLGGSASLRKDQDRTTMDVFIKRLPAEIEPFRLERKLDRYSPNQRSGRYRFIVDVSHVGVKDTQCILVDNDDHLYVTDDYILTHNTNELNWKRWEVFKTALYQGLVHAPFDEYPNPSPMGSGTFTSKDELKFLQQIATGGKFPRIEKQDIGPVQTKDMADCIAEVVYTLIGNLHFTSMRERLAHSALLGGAPGGYGIGQGGPVGGPGPPGISGYYSQREEKFAQLGGRESLTRGALGLSKTRRGNRSRGRW